MHREAVKRLPPSAVEAVRTLHRGGGGDGHPYYGVQSGEGLHPSRYPSTPPTCRSCNRLVAEGEPTIVFYHAFDEERPWMRHRMTVHAEDCGDPKDWTKCPKCSAEVEAPEWSAHWRGHRYDRAATSRVAARTAGSKRIPTPVELAEGGYTFPCPCANSFNCERCDEGLAVPGKMLCETCVEELAAYRKGEERMSLVNWEEPGEALMEWGDYLNNEGKCLTCGGTAKVPLRLPCTSCLGRGEIGGIDCKGCGGEGSFVATHLPPPSRKAQSAWDIQRHSARLEQRHFELLADQLQWADDDTRRIVTEWMAIVGPAANPRYDHDRFVRAVSQPCASCRGKGKIGGIECKGCGASGLDTEKWLGTPASPKRIRFRRRAAACPHGRVAHCGQCPEDREVEAPKVPVATARPIGIDVPLSPGKGPGRLRALERRVEDWLVGSDEEIDVELPKKRRPKPEPGEGNPFVASSQWRSARLFGFRLAQGDEDLAARVKEKLHPGRFSGMSGRMAAIVGYLVGERYTNPAISGLHVTSDGHVLAEHEGDVGANSYIGSASDFASNWGRLIDAAGLDADERSYAHGLVAQKVWDWRHFGRTAQAEAIEEEEEVPKGYPKGYVPRVDEHSQRAREQAQERAIDDEAAELRTKIQRLDERVAAVLKKDYEQVRRALREAGWRERETRDGIAFYAPQGAVPPGRKGIVTVHGSPSSPSSWKNFLSQLRREGGFEWPPRERGKAAEPGGVATHLESAHGLAVGEISPEDASELHLMAHEEGADYGH